MMGGLFEGVSLGFCLWDIPAALVLAGMILYSKIKLDKLSNLKEDYETKLASGDADKAVTVAGAAAGECLTDSAAGEAIPAAEVPLPEQKTEE